MVEVVTMSIHDRIDQANSQARDRDLARRLKYWEELPHSKIGAQQRSYIDKLWLCVGIGAAVFGAAVLLRWI
jgi:hypothetical protein